MRVTDFLIHQGWEPLDREMMLWRRDNEPELVSFFWAAHKEGIDVPHLWDEKFACVHCGMTQHRVFLQGESMKCMGIPDAKAFQDSANYVKLTDRIRQALGGGEGMIWDSKND